MTTFYETIRNWRHPMIAARKRTPNEVRDLAVRLIGAQFRPLAFYYGVLVLPLWLISAVLWMIFLKPVSANNSWGVAVGMNLLSAFLIWLTITIETRFAGSLVIQYLGLWLFSDGEKIDRKRVFRSWFEKIGQVLWYLLFTNVIRRCLFYPEIILLERAPFQKRGQRSSTRRRAKFLGAYGAGAASVSLAMANEFYLVSGVLSGYFLLASFLHVFFADHVPALFLLNFILFPIFVYGCKLFNVVFGFCEYVNLRITAEGWDVDLALRLEFARLADIDELEGDASYRPGAPTRSRVLSPVALDMESRVVEASAEIARSQEEGGSAS